MNQSELKAKYATSSKGGKMRVSALLLIGWKNQHVFSDWFIEHVAQLYWTDYTAHHFKHAFLPVLKYKRLTHSQIFSTLSSPTA